METAPMPLRAVRGVVAGCKRGLVWFTSHCLPATKSDVKKLQSLIMNIKDALEAFAAKQAEFNARLDTATTAK